LVDSYLTDTPAVTVTGKIDQAAKAIVMDVPIEQLKTTLQKPATVTTPAPVVQGVVNGQPLFAVTGFSLTGVNSSSDPLAKHWLDVAPAFTVPGSVNNSTVAAGGGGAGTGRGTLPATGRSNPAPAVTLLLLGLVVLVVGRRARSA
jgi:hypothetical protein